MTPAEALLDLYGRLRELERRLPDRLKFSEAGSGTLIDARLLVRENLKQEALAGKVPECRRREVERLTGLGLWAKNFTAGPVSGRAV